MRDALLFVVFTVVGVWLSLFLGGCEAMEERPVKVGTQTSTITLIRSYNTERECNKEMSVAPGWKINACASWNALTIACLVRVKPDATDDTLGHEVRHCFDGAWHK